MGCLAVANFVPWDILTGIAYLGISAALFLFICKRRERTFNWLFLLLAFSIAAPQTLRLLEAFSILPSTHPWIDAIKAFTTLIAFATAAVAILAVPAMLALPNREELSAENRVLRKGISETEHRFSEVADSAPARIWMTDTRGQLTYCNAQTEAFYGIPRSELLGLKAPPRVHPDDLNQCFATWLNAFQRRIPIEAEFRQLRADGEWRWTNAHVVPRFASDGLFLGYIGLMVDVTEKRHAEAALAEAKRVAEAANHAKDDFIAALSHELRTPLTPVLMTASDMEADESLSPAIRKQMGIIRQEIELETRLIDDLLDLAKVTHGKLSLRCESTNVDALLAKSVQIVREDISRKQIKVHIDNAAPITTAHADPARLQQVFWNLLKNAVKFTPAHGSIDIRTFNPDSNSLCVEIRDTGAGIEEHQIQRIFLPFEQGSATSNHQFGGLGLGLAIAKAIVEMHHGTISVTSPGLLKGTTFTVRLPVSAEIRPASHLFQPSPVQTLARFRILVVEDNEQTREVLARVLNREGHTVQTESTCTAALHAVRAKAVASPFEVLISDLGLPDGSGLELIRQIKSEFPALMAIAVSGYGTDEDVRNSLEAGFSIHLTKPISIEELRRALLASTERRGSQRHAALPHVLNHCNHRDGPAC